MDRYKLFKEGLISRFNNYQAIIGNNKANSSAGLYYSSARCILNYYEDSPVICRIHCLGVEHQSCSDDCPDEFFSDSIDILSSDIVYDLEILRTLALNNGLSCGIYKKLFIQDLIRYAGKEINCGAKQNSTPIIKTFNAYKSLYFLLVEQHWLNDIDFSDSLQLCLHLHKWDCALCLIKAKLMGPHRR